MYNYTEPEDLYLYQSCAVRIWEFAIACGAVRVALKMWLSKCPTPLDHLSVESCMENILLRSDIPVKHRIFDRYLHQNTRLGTQSTE